MTIDAPTEAGRGPEAETDVGWEAPGPGAWSFDATHATRPFDRFTAAVLVDSYAEGFRRGMRTIGSPLETIELGMVNGWPYTRVKPLGGPDDPSGKPPPRIVMSLLFRLHPELRRRHRTARTIFDDETWSPIVEWWEREVKPGFRDRLDALAVSDLADRSNEDLADHVVTIAGVVADASVNHFSNAPLVALAVGDLLRLAGDHGLTGPEAMSTLAGFSEPVREATAGIDRLVEALRAERGLAAIDGAASDLFARIEAVGPRSQTELTRYLQTVGAHLAGGATVADPTVAESPGLIQTLLRRRRDATEGSTSDGAIALRQQADAAAAALAERLPAGARPDWHRAVARARRIAPLRDDDALPLTEGLGRARLTLLEVGRRLVASGIADRPDDAVELAPDEIASTLAGHGITARELRRRVDQRRRQARLEPPTTLGPVDAPPPLDLFPPAVGRVVGAVVAFVTRFDADGEGPPPVGRGHGVSPGRVSGRARVIHGPEDIVEMEPGDILVARTTSPTYNSILAIAGGVVTETGGSICHAAVMARELGIPAVVGLPEALAIPDGAIVTVDGDNGTVEVAQRP